MSHNAEMTRETMERLTDCGLRACLHVTSANAIQSIRRDGLLPKMGPLSTQIESSPAIFMFPSWADMEDASWLWDGWPHESEPALLCVDVGGLELEWEQAGEVMCMRKVEAARITVLSETEHGWPESMPLFHSRGGLPQAAELWAAHHAELVRLRSR